MRLDPEFKAGLVMQCKAVADLGARPVADDDFHYALIVPEPTDSLVCPGWGWTQGTGVTYRDGYRRSEKKHGSKLRTKCSFDEAVRAQ
jgi:hypothetical protein